MSQRSQQDWADLVQQTKNTLPSELGPQAWYISIVSPTTDHTKVYH